MNAHTHQRGHTLHADVSACNSGTRGTRDSKALRLAHTANRDQLDLDKLDAAHMREWVPFSVRYGYRKISDWARVTDRWPGVPGRLWDLVGSAAHGYEEK